MAFRTKLYLNRVGLSGVMMGLCWTPAEKFDTKFNEAIRSFGEGGLDLCAMDCVRGEDNGTGVYN
jgi:hypothetical protein